MTNDERNVFKNALSKWGADLQIVVTFEEIADVEIMLSQMKLFFNIEEGVKSHKEYKIKRLMDRVGCQSEQTCGTFKEA